MIIGIEAERSNHPEKTGVEHYAQQLILHLAKIDHVNQYRLYLRTAPEKWFFSLPKNFTVKVISFPKFWTQIRLSLEMLLHPVDVLLIPASALPLIHPKKSIVTLHDTSFIHYPDADTTFMRNFLDYSYRFIAKKAWRIIAISESTKQDLMKFYNIDSKKIRVIHHGYDLGQEIGNRKEEIVDNNNITTRLPKKYLLFLSTLQPRKNLPALISAFRKFKNKHPEQPHKLVVVGKPGWKYEESLRAIENNKDIVVYLGHVADDDRVTIYKQASAFISASVYEGFGMWILEAFEAGIPAAVSDVSSLPEIAGNAALLFDPHNESSIELAIEKILLDENLRQELVAKSKVRLQDFSWEKTAKQTLDLIEHE